MHQMVSNGSSKSKRSSSLAQDDSKSKSLRITKPTSAAMPGSKLHDKLPGSGGRQDEAEEDESDIDSESEYTSSDVDADDENEGDDQQEEVWQAIPSELIPDQASPGGKRKVTQSEALAPSKRYKRSPRAGIQKRTDSTRRKRDTVEKGIARERRAINLFKTSKGRNLSLSEHLEKAHRRYGHVAPKRLVGFKKKGRIYSSLIPDKGRLEFKAKHCPIFNER